MQNPEEDILKRFLQDTFSDYEPMPTEQSWEQIHKALHPQKPSVGGRLKQWIIPVVGLLLLIGGLVWKTNQTSDELKENSIALLAKPEVIEGSRPSKGGLPFANNEFLKKENTPEKLSVKNTGTNSYTTVGELSAKTQTTAEEERLLDNQLINNELKNESKKLLVNKTTSNEVGELPIVTKKQSEVFGGNMVDEITSNTVTTEESKNVLLVSLDEKSSLNIVSKEPSVENTDMYSQTKAEGKRLDLHSSDSRILELDVAEKIHQSLNPNGATLRNPSSDGIISEKIVSDNAVIEKVRYTRPIETLKNKDFVITKPQFGQAKMNQISIAKETKPIRRPTYISLSIMPLQTYRLLTVGSKDIQNLQTNKLFDSERNGFALELGIVKPIANLWNLRTNISYLKMRQWAEYQVNTEAVSVKNSFDNSNNSAVGTNDNEFVGQTKVENKTLQMVGLKADVQKFFKLSGRNRYFVSTGTQMMYETNEKQTNVFINASAGFQHLVNKDLFLTVEPTASYLLYNINDSKSLIQTNAYNLGLKIGVNFRVK